MTGGVETHVEHVWICGIPIVQASAGDVLEEIEERLDRGEQVRLSYANAHTLRLAARDERLKQALLSSDLVLNDGIGVELAARMRGEHFPENLNGSDFNPRLLEMAAERHWSVYMLGAEPGVSETAAEHACEAFPGLPIAGTEHGYTDDDPAELAERVHEHDADVLMVAMGNPDQEIWLEDQLERSGARLGVAVGAFLDFTAGHVRRAPAWMNRWGVEWCYRLAQEPRRLAERYLVGIPAFLRLAWAERSGDLSRRRLTGGPAV
jgi:exopolysaccharide biosynthesis WecB/TagA/CpsF family protein